MVGVLGGSTPRPVGMNGWIVPRKRGDGKLGCLRLTGRRGRFATAFPAGVGYRRAGSICGLVIGVLDSAKRAWQTPTLVLAAVF
jgi:hypothetical protein